MFSCLKCCWKNRLDFNNLYVRSFISFHINHDISEISLETPLQSSQAEYGWWDKLLAGIHTQFFDHFDLLEKFGGQECG